MHSSYKFLLCRSQSVVLNQNFSLCGYKFYTEKNNLFLVNCPALSPAVFYHMCCTLCLLCLYNYRKSSQLLYGVTINVCHILSPVILYHKCRALSRDLAAIANKIPACCQSWVTFRRMHSNVTTFGCHSQTERCRH